MDERQLRAEISHALELQNERLSQLAGFIAATRFVVEVMLTNWLASLPSNADRAGLMADLLRVGSKTEGLHASTEEQAMALSDQTVHLQDSLRTLLEAARDRLPEALRP